MNHRAAPLTETAHRLITALRRETSLARAVAMAELKTCVTERRAALAAFGAARGLAPAHAPEAQEEHAAMHALLDAAIENALVLEAVQAMLDEATRTSPERLGPNARDDHACNDHARAERMQTNV